MSPIKAFISIAALLITTISAIPTQIHERTTSCPSGSFLMKLFYQNANGNMVWNGQYATDLGGPLGSTSSASATAFYVDSNSNLIKTGNGYAGCLLTAPFAGQPTNTTVLIPKAACVSNGYPLVQCIQTPLYNMCYAGPNKVIQQCGQFILMNPQQVPSAGGASCGPSLVFGIQNC